MEAHLESEGRGKTRVVAGGWTHAHNQNSGKKIAHSSIAVSMTRTRTYVRTYRRTYVIAVDEKEGRLENKHNNMSAANSQQREHARMTHATPPPTDFARLRNYGTSV